MSGQRFLVFAFLTKHCFGSRRQSWSESLGKYTNVISEEPRPAVQLRRWAVTGEDTP